MSEGRKDDEGKVEYLDYSPKDIDKIWGGYTLATRAHAFYTYKMPLNMRDCLRLMVSNHNPCRPLMLGADKYGPDNWRDVKNGFRRYFNAMLRHDLAWAHDEPHDPDSGFSHLEHRAANAAFLLELM